MAGTITLTDGVVSIPLVYNASSQPAYRLQYGGRLQLSPTITIEHQPDTAAPCPVIGWDTDRTFFFTLDIGSDEVTDQYACQGWDSPLDAIVALKRLVDGADQQALRYWTDGDVREVVLQTQIDGTSNIVSHSVKLGNVDDGSAPYSQFTHSEVALDVVVSLRVAPYGHGATFTLQNELLDASGMLVGAGGLATGLSLIGAPTPTLDNTIYLFGGQSQKIVTAAGGAEGFETGLVSATTEDIIGYVWLYIVAGGDDISVALVTNIGTLDTKVLTPTDANDVSDQKAVDSQGNTWYRVPVSGTPGIPITDVKLTVQRVLAPSVATTFYADMTYIALNETVQPLGWSSRSAMQNDGVLRNNHLDVFGISGDVAALVTHKITLGGGGTDIQNFTVSRGIDGKFLIADQPHWQDATTSYTTKGGAGTWATVAGGSGGTHEQYTVDAGSPTTDTGTATATISGDAARKILASTHRVFARVRTSFIGVKFSFSVATPDGIFNGAPNDVNVINQFELVDLGLINGKNILPDNPPDPLKPDMTFTISVTGFTLAGQTAGIDGFYLLYADDDFMIGQTLEPIGANSDIWIVGENTGGFVVTESRGQKEPRILGSAYELKEGFVGNRIVYTWAELDNLHALGLTFDTALEVTPRTRHLLGTI